MPTNESLSIVMSLQNEIQSLDLDLSEYLDPLSEREKKEKTEKRSALLAELEEAYTDGFYGYSLDSLKRNLGEWAPAELYDRLSRRTYGLINYEDYENGGMLPGMYAVLEWVGPSVDSLKLQGVQALFASKEDALFYCDGLDYHELDVNMDSRAPALHQRWTIGYVCYEDIQRNVASDASDSGAVPPTVVLNPFLASPELLSALDRIEAKSRSVSRVVDN